MEGPAPERRLRTLVDPAVLSFDIVAMATSVALPGIAWAILFFLAWKHPAFSESLGLGRREFWLLLPGAILASFALLPVAPVTNDVVAIGFAGALFPLAVGLLTLERWAPPFGRSAARLLVLLGIEGAVLLALVLPWSAPIASGAGSALRVGTGGGEIVVVTLAAAALVAGALATLDRAHEASGRAVAAAFGLTSAVLVLTFAGARAIPGLGIVEEFPYFLLPPVLGGLAAAAVAPVLFPQCEGFALPLAFLTTGWGVTLGADLLRQPPLYGHGAPGLYVIGGAGVLDLVYLSGFVGLLGAYAVHALLRRSFAPIGEPRAPPPPSPTGRLREAFGHGVEGRIPASLEASASAARAAALQARRLRGEVEPTAIRPWAGLPVPGWVVSDQANLESVARSGTTDPREALRAWTTARWLVLLGRDLGRGRFATISQRLGAIAVDLALLVGVATAVFAALVARTPGSLSDVLGNVAFNGAIYGFVAASLLYFAVAEAWTGTTVGKYLVGIEVRDRALRRLDGTAALLRNTPLLPALTLIALGLGVAVAIALRGIAPAGTELAGISVLAGTLALIALGGVVVGGVGLAAIVGIVVIAGTAERQRVGDLWAGSWVVRRLSRTSPRPGPGAPERDRSL